MFNSDDEFIMDFEAEEKRAQLPMFNTEDIDSDCTTISATETYEHECSNAMQPSFWEPKKVRVLIKKLPRHILKKYKLNNKKTPTRVSHPSRCSGRLKNKHVPLGKYLALHVNKPLSKILIKNKKNNELNQMKAAEKQSKEKPFNLNEKKKIPCGLKLKTPDGRKPDVAKVISTPKNTVNTERNSREKNLATRLKDNERIINSLPNSPDVNFNSPSPWGIINRPVTSTLPNCPDVMITRYHIPPTSIAISKNPIIPNTSLPTALGNNYLQNSVSISKPQNYTHRPASYSFLSANYSGSDILQPSSVFPAVITPAGNPIQIPCQPRVFNTAGNTTNVGIRPPINSAPRTFTIQAFKVPHELSAPNIQSSPKVLIIKQPSLGTDPLYMPTANAINTSLTKKLAPATEQIHSDTNYPDSESVVSVESESDSESTDSEKRKEPEVIKRIIYNTKSVQTKFTCNGSICGLVDSDEFNFNCFYCYDIFPLHKWFEFKEHIKLVHHVEEKENQSDLNDDVCNSSSHRGHQTSSCENINATKTVSPTPHLMSKNDATLTKGVTNGDKYFKKLPLEPKLITQCANKAYTDPIKISSTPTTPSINQSEVSGQSSGSKLSNEINNVYTDKIINLNRENCNLCDVTKTAAEHLQLNNGTANNQSYLKKSISQINDVKILVPSLPNITITKANQTLSMEAINRKPSTRPFRYKNSIINLPNLTTQESSEKPRYFLVKKVIKLPPGQTVPNINISQGAILAKVKKSEKSNSSKKDCDDMPSNNENKDSVSKPTKGCGIVFGVTNSIAVIEFLLKLKSFPQLWQPQLVNISSSNYNECVKKLCFHLNSRFKLNLTDIETRQSVERVKDWYSQIVKDIKEHNENPNNTQPYKHKFQIYFKILQSFLAFDVQNKNAVLTYPQSKSSTNTSTKEKACNTGTLSPVGSFKASQTTAISTTMPYVTPKNIDSNENTDKAAESIIEFDADILYGNEISDEEVSDKTVHKRIVVNRDHKKKRTKIYVGVYECEFCRKVFKRKCDLKRHKVGHYPPQFECGQCSQKFYFKHIAEKCSHKRNANSIGKRIWPKKIFESKLICEICGTSYRSIGSLNTHKKDKHLNQRDKCVVCNFSALSNWRVVKHQQKRHIVEPGTVEEIAKKCRPRTETKTRFSNEARQEFDWRREMRKKLKPGEIFYGCCKCRITFNSRKEKVFHNKIEHPITEFTVICLLCLPHNKLLLSNSNSARRHYTDIHKVAWHEIDGLVKRTKPIFNLLSKEEIEILKASENYMELLEELLKDKKLEPAENIQTLAKESLTAVQNLPTSLTEIDEDVGYSQEETVYVDGIIDHDYNFRETYRNHEHTTNRNEHNYSEKKDIFENYDELEVNNDDFYSQRGCDDGIVHLAYDIESSDAKLYNYIQNDQDYVEDFVGGEQVEESLVVEEYIDEVIDQEDDFFKVRDYS